MPGHYIGEPDGRFSDSEYEYQYNVVFDLPTARNVDILYVLMGTIGSRADKEIQKAFVDSLPRVLIVTLFADIEGYPSVTFDNETGIVSILDHLTMINSYRDREDRVFRMVNNQMVNELNVADISMVSLVAHQLSVTVRSLI